MHPAVRTHVEASANNCEGYAFFEMSNPDPQPSGAGGLELPVNELLMRARPLLPHDEMVTDDPLPTKALPSSPR